MNKNVTTLLDSHKGNVTGVNTWTVYLVIAAVLQYSTCACLFRANHPGRQRGVMRRIFSSSYVEGSVPNDWLWRRISGSEASTIMALGTVAEHGILRLLSRNMNDVLVTDSVRPAIRFTYDKNNVKWSQHYANTERKIKDRKELKCHWKVTGGLSSGQQRWWNVVVEPHPAAFGDRSYAADMLKNVYKSR